MDFVKGLGDKVNSAAGGGKEGEKQEDYLDKGEHHASFCDLFKVLTRM